MCRASTTHRVCGSVVDQLWITRGRITRVFAVPPEDVRPNTRCIHPIEDAFSSEFCPSNTCIDRRMREVCEFETGHRSHPRSHHVFFVSHVISFGGFPTAGENREPSTVSIRIGERVFSPGHDDVAIV